MRRLGQLSHTNQSKHCRTDRWHWRMLLHRQVQCAEA